MQEFHLEILEWLKVPLFLTFFTGPKISSGVYISVLELLLICLRRLNYNGIAQMYFITYFILTAGTLSAFVKQLLSF